MNLDSKACQVQADALNQAAIASPVTMIRRPLFRKAREWREAGECLGQFDEDEAEICLAGALEAGCTVSVMGRTLSLIRIVVTGERLALHVMDDANGREEYVNLWGGRTSPVVVLR